MQRFDQNARCPLDGVRAERLIKRYEAIQQREGKTLAAMRG
jgi:hypothetical protein